MKVQGPSDKLLDLIFDALSDAVQSARAAGSPIVPFLLAQIGDFRRRKPLAVDPADGATQAGRRLASDLPNEVDCVAFAYDGFITTEDGRSDAILVEAHERGMSRSLIFAQRYRPKTFLHGFSTLGNPLLFAVCEPFLGGAETARDVDFF